MTDKQFYILLGVGFLGLWYAKNKVVKVAGDVGQAINPVNRDNIFSQGVNSVGGALTGQPDFSLGVWVYDLVHGEGEAL